jgi:hypothetical protein
MTALGMGERSSRIMEQLVRQANGHLVKALVLYKLRPNDDENFFDRKQNQELAVEMATQAAMQIEPPAA